MPEHYGRYKGLEKMSSISGFYTFYVGALLAIIGFCYRHEKNGMLLMIAGILIFVSRLGITSIWVDAEFIYFWASFASKSFR